MIKMIAAAFLLFMLIIPQIALADDFTIEDAYAECCEFYPEFIANIKASGVSDEQILSFLTYIQDLLIAESDEITEENFDKYFYNATNTAIGNRRYIAVRNALAKAYPSAVTQFEEEGVIPEEFQPLYVTIKNLVFVHGLIGTAEERAAVSFVSDTMAGFFVSESARAVIAVYDAEGILCSVESRDIEADCEIEFAAIEGGSVKLMVLGDALEPLCAAAEKNF
ncbi:MAG: hypothetical protein LUG52_08035 [Clostridia bacterium]|nr:hypothetical protein [Clostridia bacterium]